MRYWATIVVSAPILFALWLVAEVAMTLLVPGLRVAYWAATGSSVSDEEGREAIVRVFLKK